MAHLSPDIPQIPGYHSVKDVADALGITRRQANRIVAAQEEVYRLGDSFALPSAAFLALLQRGKQSRSAAGRRGAEVRWGKGMR